MDDNFIIYLNEGICKKKHHLLAAIDMTCYFKKQIKIGGYIPIINS